MYSIVIVDAILNNIRTDSILTGFQ